MKTVNLFRSQNDNESISGYSGKLQVHSGNWNDLGEKVRQFRKRARLSQIKLESQADLTLCSLSRIETNKINPTKETLVKIINALELSAIDAAHLFGININRDILK